MGYIALALLPVRLLWAVVQYLLGTGNFRKYRNSLTNRLKLTVYRTAVGLGPAKAWVLYLYSNKFLINRIIRLSIGNIAREPYYGQSYDGNSIWLSRKSGNKVIVYLHGGGYFLQTQPEQVKSLLGIYKLLEPEHQATTSLLLLDYKLVCHGHTFPTQINQLDETYNQLVADGFNEVTLVGDSAGGNLAVNYTQVLRNRRDPVWPKNLVLISPWLKLRPDPEDLHPGKSYDTNSKYDMITTEAFSDPLVLFNIVGKEDYKALHVSPGNKQPGLADDWTPIPTYGEPGHAVLVLVGEDESLRDSVLDWAQHALGVPFYNKVKYGNSHLELKKEHYEYHRNDGKLARVQLHVEPLGLHDSVLFFEDHIVSKVKRGPVSVAELDDTEFFGVRRVVGFLNEVL